MSGQGPVIRPYGPAAIAEAAALIRTGRPVGIATETVYGLAADATNGAAVAGIYAAKGRPSFNPLIVHVGDVAAARIIAEFDADADRLAGAFWPGPLTLVLPMRNDAPIAGLVTAGLSTVGIRVPAHPAMRDLLAAAERPLAAPSANASGAISATRAEHVVRSLGNAVLLVIDSGPTSVGIESTIVAAGDAGWRLLRPGPIDELMIADLLGRPALPAPVAIVAPGMLASHYAPSKPLRLDATEPAPGEWLIGFGPVAGDANLSASGDLIEAAAALFERLHQADAAPAPRIAVAPVPHLGLGIAINDRLTRAAAPLSWPSSRT